MITSIELTAFKCFRTLKLPCAQLTLLTGLNSAGKSSAIQALLLLRQSYLQRELQRGELALNGELIKLGTAQDVLYERADSDFIEIALKYKNEKMSIEGNWKYDYQRTANVLRRVEEQSSKGSADDLTQMPLFGNNFHYLCAERLGPRTHFDKSDSKVRVQGQIGVQGEFAAHYLDQHGNTLVDASQQRILTLQAPASSLRLIDQVTAWLSLISPGVRIQVNEIAGADLVQLGYAFASRRDVSRFYRPTNVGFGLTYTLSVLVALLSAKPGSLVIVENPEAHLHPRGQVRLGELLALTAADGIQVIVETHSDHILNGVRLMARKGKPSHDSVATHYFERYETREGLAEHGIISPILKADGRFDRWPDGFFDEWERSLEALLTEPVSEPSVPAGETA